jgi:hypothetical protein
VMRLDPWITAMHAPATSTQSPFTTGRRTYITQARHETPREVEIGGLALARVVHSGSYQMKG